MNDNVKKIPLLEKFAAQSLVESDGELIFSKEKFAELIVRECIDTAFHKGHPDLEFLLKHFGVEGIE